MFSPVCNVKQCSLCWKCGHIYGAYVQKTFTLKLPYSQNGIIHLSIKAVYGPSEKFLKELHYFRREAIQNRNGLRFFSVMKCGNSNRIEYSLP